MNEASSSSTSAFDSDLPQFKVVLLGEGAVGKSSILLRYTENKFNVKHLSTLEDSYNPKFEKTYLDSFLAAYANKQIFIDDKAVELNIWDTAGQEKFHSLGPIYYRGSQGALLVYDVTDRNSFERVQNWVKELRQMLGNAAVLLIVGNKLDLDEKRTVPESEAIEYSSSVNAIFRECSAKENIGIDIAFDELARAMLSNMQNDKSTISRKRPSSRRSLRVVDDEQMHRNGPSGRKGCC